jgi:hypothetical protein
LVIWAAIVSQSQIGAISAKSISSGQARLILQDPLAFEQATQPALRSSLELESEPTTLLEREKAREQWESLSLEPEVAQQRQAERKRLLSRADQLSREIEIAKARSMALEAELARDKEDRLNRPLVYAGAAGIVALGALWFIERRKRLTQQDKELEAWAQLSSLAPSSKAKANEPHQNEPTHLRDAFSVFSLESPSDFAQEDVAGFDHRPGQNPSPVADSPVSSSTQAIRAKPDWARSRNERPSSQALRSHPNSQDSMSQPAGGFLGKTKQAFGQLWTRSSQRSPLNSAGYSAHSRADLHTEGLEYSTFRHSESVESTQILPEYDRQASSSSNAYSQLPAISAGIIPSTRQGNIDSLASIRTRNGADEDAMELLLELRMAADGLSALGRPMAAIDLLQAQIEADAQTCAWAYLECMHICEQMDERGIFESMRKRYRQQFNRMAPYWYEPNANVIGLDGYARAASELCAAWSQGYQHTREVLASWLTGPLLGRKLVQLPAYHDLFDLYEMLEILEKDASKEAIGSSSKAPMMLVSNERSSMEKSHFMETHETGFEFVTTVSLLDLDYEFSSDVTLQEGEVAQSEKAVTIVKPGNFSVDFNVAGTQLGGLFSIPAELDKK